MTQPTAPTQVQHPGRATLRTAIAATIALLPVLPAVVDQLGISGIPVVASAVALAAGITRVLALPVVADWIEDRVPWLAPRPKPSPPDGSASGGSAD